MAKIAQGAKLDIVVREKAKEVTRYVQPKDWRGQVNAVFEYVRDCIRYIHDIRGVETIQWPRHTIESGQGDCDDKCVLLSAMLESINHPTQFVALAFRPNQFSHVIVQTRLGGPRNWISMDPTEQQPLGWEPPGVVDRKRETV